MAEPVADEVPDLELGKEKKKKKKKDKPAPDAAADDAAAAGDDDAEFLNALKKRKPKKKKETEMEAVMETGASGGGGYQYKELLDLIYQQLKEQNPEFGVKTKITLKPPRVEKCGAKKTSFVNFAEICNSLKRPEDHLFQFIGAELSTSGAVDSNSCLILKGKFMPKHVEGLLRKYINEYVICAMCRSLETTLSKDQHSRLSSIQCNKCGANRTVSNIQGSFQAVKLRKKR